ncbi:MAG TPA: hypothetical protein VI341_03805 [Actinomycetota bacterium]
MRIDRTAMKPSRPKALPWDNSGLRDRLQGQDLTELQLEELHALARDNDEPISRWKRQGRARNTVAT